MLFLPDGTVHVDSHQFQGIRDLPTLQHGPHHDEVVRKVRFPVDERQADVRLYFAVEQLETLLAVARSSPTRRVVLHDAYFEVEQRKTKGGHAYDVLYPFGRAVPEYTGAERSLLAREGRS